MLVSVYCEERSFVIMLDICEKKILNLFIMMTIAVSSHFFGTFMEPEQYSTALKREQGGSCTIGWKIYSHFQL